MKYAVTLVQNETVCAAYLFDTKPEAMARYHHELEYAYTACAETMCCVVNTNGAMLASEKCTATAPAPEPEAEGGEAQ